MKVFPPDNNKKNEVMAPGPTRQAPKAPKIAEQPATGTRTPKLLLGEQ